MPRLLLLLGGMGRALCDQASSTPLAAWHPTHPCLPSRERCPPPALQRGVLPATCLPACTGGQAAVQATSRGRAPRTLPPAPPRLWPCRDEGVVEARSVDAALEALSLDGQGAADRHPEK